MFYAIFAFVFIATHVAVTTAKIPPFVHVCGRNDSNYNQCIANNIMNMRAKICEKNPEFGLPSFEPLIFDKMVVIEEPMINLYLRNAKVRGICDFIINSVHANLDKLQFNINLTLKRIYMTTMYDVALRLLVPISRIGLCHVTLDNIGLKVSLDMKVTTKNNKKYIYASKVNVKVETKNFEYEFDESEKDLVEFHKILSDIINTNTQIIINAVNPVVEKRFSELILVLFNNLTQSNYDEFFPEKV